MTIAVYKGYKMIKLICKSCNEPNLEMHWLQIGDKWVCAYCYNGNYTVKQMQRIRKNNK
jgi:formylmethanofuran dehydrogenase subunit E